MEQNPPQTPLEKITKVKLEKGDICVYISLITVRVLVFHCLYRLYSQNSGYYQAQKGTQKKWFDCKTKPIYVPLDNMPNKINE